MWTEAGTRAGRALGRGVSLAMSLACCALSVAAYGAYPEKPVRLIVGFPAGGGSDILARALAERVGAEWGQQVIVDNRPGASGNIAAEIAARSAPDGYTLYLGTSSSHAINASLYRHLGYDPQKDFVPVTLVASAQNVLVVHPAVPAKSVAELIALAKREPGRLSYASTGIGTSSHLAAELFKHSAGADIVHVPYKGPAAMIDLIAGAVHLAFARIPVALPHVSAGRLRMLAVTGARRSALLPDVPTIAESGLKGYDVTAWFGVLLPRGTPSAIVDAVHDVMVKALQDDSVRERLLRQDFELAPSTPAQFAELIRTDTAKWAKIIRMTGIRAN